MRVIFVEMTKTMFLFKLTRLLMFMLGQMSSFALVTMVELLKLKVGRAALIRAHG